MTRSRRPAASRASDATSFGESPGARASISVADRALGEAREGNELAPRPDRVGQWAEVVGDEDDDGVRRRLLEVLEQRVGGVLVHRLGAVHEVDAAVGLERPHVQVAAELADVIDADLVPDRLDEVDVWMRAALDAAVITDQLAGERDGGRALADARGAVEEVRVRGPFVRDGRPQQALCLCLLRKALEGVHGSPLRSPRAGGCRPPS